MNVQTTKAILKTSSTGGGYQCAKPLPPSLHLNFDGIKKEEICLDYFEESIGCYTDLTPADCPNVKDSSKLWIQYNQQTNEMLT